MKKLLATICVIGMLIASLFYARRTFPCFNFLFPPQDMFQALASSQVNLALVGNAVLLGFKPKYPGNHELDLEVDKLVLGEPLKGKLVLSVLIKNQKKEQVKAKVRPYESFWSPQSKGFPLMAFDVPKDIKIGETGTVEVTISNPDPEFFKTYGAAHLVVRKGSDE